MALKLIFMGTPEFAVPILKTINESRHVIQTVYTNEPTKSNRGQRINLSPVHKYAEMNNLNVRCPKTLDTENEHKFLISAKPDVVIVVAYGKILPKKILKINKTKFINIHASLLPRWRGAAPIQRAIMSMDKETGISIMKIIPKLDAGPFMLQKKINITDKDDFISLSEKLSKVASKLILESLDLIEKNKFNFVNQDDEKATYAKKIEKIESRINWSLPAENIIAKIKALNPYPGSWFQHNNIRFKIIKAKEIKINGEIGKVLTDDLVIGCKENAVKIILIQKQGKKILSTKTFLSGHKIKKGEILN